MSCECLHSKIIHRTWKELNGEKIDRFLCTTCGTEFIPKIRPKQEELMSDHIVDVNKKVQMTREQANDLCSVIYGKTQTNFNAIIKRLSDAGYILPDPVEIAEQAYNQINLESSYNKQDYNDVINKLYKAILFMKPYYEKARSADEK